MKNSGKCGGVIFNSDKTKMVVVHQRYNGKPAKWGCPKGHKKRNETNHYCAHREIYEELGIRVKTMDTDPKIKVGNTVYFSYVILNIEKEMVPIDSREICEVRLIDLLDIDIPLSNMNYELKTIIQNINVFKETSKITFCL